MDEAANNLNLGWKFAFDKDNNLKAEGYFVKFSI